MDWIGEGACFLVFSVARSVGRPEAVGGVGVELVSVG